MADTPRAPWLSASRKWDITGSNLKEGFLWTIKTTGCPRLPSFQSCPSRSKCQAAAGCNYSDRCHVSACARAFSCAWIRGCYPSRSVRGRNRDAWTGSVCASSVCRNTVEFTARSTCGWKHFGAAPQDWPPALDRPCLKYPRDAPSLTSRAQT